MSFVVHTEQIDIAREARIYYPFGMRIESSHDLISMGYCSVYCILMEICTPNTITTIALP